MAQGANNGAASGKQAADLKQFRQLVELQRQIVEIDRRNAETARQCAALRRRLARETQILTGSRLLRRQRLGVAAVEFIRRWREREAWSVALKWLS